RPPAELPLWVGAGEAVGERALAAVGLERDLVGAARGPARRERHLPARGQLAQDGAEVLRVRRLAAPRDAARRIGDAGLRGHPGDLAELPAHEDAELHAHVAD